MSDHPIILVGGAMDEAKFDLSVYPGSANPNDEIPGLLTFGPLVYRRTNVYIPGRHDADGSKRRVYVTQEWPAHEDEDILDRIVHTLDGGEAGGA